jgi:hypothetical protein
MAEFSSEFSSSIEIDIEPSEFVDNCSRSEIKELIEILVNEGHLPKSVLRKLNISYSPLEEEFSDKLDELSKKYHSISSEDEEILNKIFKKYI